MKYQRNNPYLITHTKWLLILLSFIFDSLELHYMVSMQKSVDVFWTIYRKKRRKLILPYIYKILKIKFARGILLSSSHESNGKKQVAQVNLSLSLQKSMIDERTKYILNVHRKPTLPQTKHHRRNPSLAFAQSSNQLSHFEMQNAI